MNTSNLFHDTLDVVLSAFENKDTIRNTAQVVKSGYCDNGYFKLDMYIDLAEVLKQCATGLNDEAVAFCSKVITECSK